MLVFIVTCSVGCNGNGHQGLILWPELPIVCRSFSSHESKKDNIREKSQESKKIILNTNFRKVKYNTKEKFQESKKDYTKEKSQES